MTAAFDNPMRDFEHTASTMREFARQFDRQLLGAKAVANFHASVRSAQKAMSGLKLHLNFDPNPMAELASRLARESEECRRIEAAGWLPHVTMPIAELADAGKDPKRASQIIEEYYRTHWEEIEARFRREASAYDVDPESKAAFDEALRAHGQGFYRLTAAALFSAVERASRRSVGVGKRRIDTSLAELRAKAGKLVPREMGPRGVYSFSMFKKMEAEFYADCDASNADQFGGNPVPNRHGAAHGLIVYKDFKSSLNALIMADFMLRLVSAIKRRADEDARRAGHS